MSPQMPSARPKRSALLPGAEPLCTPSGQLPEPCVARPSWSLHKQTGLLRRFPDFRPHDYFRKTGRQSTCGFTSVEFGVLSYAQSNVVNRHGLKWHLITGSIYSIRNAHLGIITYQYQANCTERWPAIWSQRISSLQFLVCSATPIAHTRCE